LLQDVGIGGETVLCPPCGHENGEDATFRLECGGRLAVTCPGCQRELRREAGFFDAGRKELKGIPGRQRVYDVVW
jgi:hypothetical protein